MSEQWEGRRGRPPKDEPASIILTIRVTPTQWLKLRDIAEQNQSALSALIREAIDEAVSDCDSPVFRHAS